MKNFIFRKVLYKKWLNSGMLFAIVLLVGIICANPMYRAAISQKMVCSYLNQAYEENKEDPGYVSVIGEYLYGNETETDSKVFDDVTTIPDQLKDMLDMPVKAEIHHLALIKSFYNKGEKSEKTKDDEESSNVSRSDMIVGSFNELEKHVKLKKGKIFSDKINSDGTIDCVLTHTVMEDEKLLLGDVITIEKYQMKGDLPLKLKIVGVIEEKDYSDPYWTKEAKEFRGESFISQKLFNNLLPQLSGTIKVTSDNAIVFDYQEMSSAKLSKIYDSVAILDGQSGVDKTFKCHITMKDAFDKYKKESGKTSITMWMLQVPMMVLLLAFIFMTSRQVFETEKNEISMLASRGASRLQIVLMYLFQSVLLAGAGLILGLILGYILCGVIGSANAFMEFVSRKSLHIRLNFETILYALGAALTAVAFITLPVVGYSKIGIIELKTKKKKKQKPVWYRFYLDIIILLVCFYLFRNMSNQKNLIISNVLSGKSVDGLFYLIAPLFMLGAGMLSFRLMQWVIRLIYQIGRKKWGPSTYTSFLYLIREGKAQWFISVFLILTIAMGIFNSNFARTINENEQERIQYNLGSDVVMQETWENNMPEVLRGMSDTLIYTEPEYYKYDKIDKKHIVSKTKVIVDENATYMNEDDAGLDIKLMGIETKKFGETARMRDGLTKEHWFTYLNTLAKKGNGAIISKNLAEKKNLKVGDDFYVNRKDVLGKDMGMVKVEICAITDAFPGYNQYAYSVNQSGKLSITQNYLVVCNFSMIFNSFTTNPYQIWMKTNGDNKAIYDFIKNNKIPIDSMKDLVTLKADQKNEPTFQVTNGLLTISFVVVLVISMVGFLIYWIISIRQRELLFGVYRAMGMSMNGVLKILVVEHLFSSLCSIGIGVGIGVLTTKLFLPLVSLVYIPEKHIIPLDVVTSPWDMTRLGICIVIMLAICFYVLGKILKKMKISQVLKLGED